MSPPISIHADRSLLNGIIGPVSLALRPNSTKRITGSEARIQFDETHLMLPGMINAHDHLEFNSFPVLGRRAAYKDMYEWADELRGQMDSPQIRASLAIPLEDRLRIGGFKNLINGVTTVAHHNPYHSCMDDAFPVRVIQNYTWSHSLGLDTGVVKTFRKTPTGTPWIIHAAEGVSTRAGDEIDELHRDGLLAANTVLVHALGARPAHHEPLVRYGVGIVACPVSNLFLYGSTIAFDDVPGALNIALGSDSALSSSSGLQEDLRVFRSMVNWSEERILAMVTSNAARILKLNDSSGDVVILTEEDVVLVIINGRVVYGEEQFRNLFEEEPRRISVGGRPKLVSNRIRVPWESLQRAAEWTPYLRDIHW